AARAGSHEAGWFPTSHVGSTSATRVSRVVRTFFEWRPWPLVRRVGAVLVRRFAPFHPFEISAAATPRVAPAKPCGPKPAARSHPRRVEVHSRTHFGGQLHVSPGKLFLLDIEQVEFRVVLCAEALEHGS